MPKQDPNFIPASVSLTLETLTDLVNLINHHEAEAARYRVIRNNFLRNARESGMMVKSLYPKAHLSRQQVTTIINSPYES